MRLSGGDEVDDDDDDCGYELSLEHIKVARETMAGLQGRLQGLGSGEEGCRLAGK